MNYIGEHLLPGQIGYFLVVLSLVSSLVASIAYYRSAVAINIDDQLSWRKIGRMAFITDAVSVMAVFAIIYYIISRHYFEYNYAWSHSDKSLWPWISYFQYLGRTGRQLFIMGDLAWRTWINH